MSHGNNAAALLIDADNLSPEGMSEALARLDAEGLRVTLRRAYGSHETLAAVKDMLQAASFRVIVNQGRGTTDAALVVDAMDLLHAGCLPRVVAVGSADGDFAPLVVRLREAGMRVICFAQRKKAPEGLGRFYDEVIFVDEPPRAVSARPNLPAAKPPARKAIPKAVSGKKPKRAPAQEPLPLQLPLPVSAPLSTPAPEPPSVTALVRRVLDSIPGFLDGQEIELNEVVKRLRDEKLMAKSTSARNFFKKHAPDIELRPEKQPNKLLLPSSGMRF